MTLSGPWINLNRSCWTVFCLPHRQWNQRAEQKLKADIPDAFQIRLMQSQLRPRRFGLRGRPLIIAQKLASSSSKAGSDSGRRLSRPPQTCKRYRNDLRSIRWKAIDHRPTWFMREQKKVASLLVSLSGHNRWLAGRPSERSGWNALLQTFSMLFLLRWPPIQLPIQRHEIANREHHSQTDRASWANQKSVSYQSKIGVSPNLAGVCLELGNKSSTNFDQIKFSPKKNFKDAAIGLLFSKQATSSRDFYPGACVVSRALRSTVRLPPTAG